MLARSAGRHEADIRRLRASASNARGRTWRERGCIVPTCAVLGRLRSAGMFHGPAPGLFAPARLQPDDRPRLRWGESRRAGMPWPVRPQNQPVSPSVAVFWWARAWVPRVAPVAQEEGRLLVRVVLALCRRAASLRAGVAGCWRTSRPPGVAGSGCCACDGRAGFGCAGADAQFLSAISFPSWPPSQVRATVQLESQREDPPG